MKTYSTFSIARMLQVDPGSVANWIDQGLLRAHRTPGRHRRVLESDLLEFLKAQRMPVPPQLESEGGKRVLVIDSDRCLLDAIRRAMKSAHPHYEVLEASDAFRAGALLTSGTPTVLILDLKMPGLDPFDICKMLKSQPKTKSIHILATGPRADQQSQKEIIRCGAAACLSKPLDVHVLMKEMQTLLK